MPIGSLDFVTAFVNSKTAVMVDNLRKLQVLSNGLTNFRLVKFCHNTFLPNRNLPPAVMRNTLCGLQTVDAANAMEVMWRGTDTAAALSCSTLRAAASTVPRLSFLSSFPSPS